MFARKIVDLQKSPKTDFQKELKAMQDLCSGSHPHLVKVLRHGEFSCSPHAYIDMELCHMSLKEYNKAIWTVACVETDCPTEIRAKQIWNIMKQIANGLEFIHNQGMIHRDLKPANGETPCERMSYIYSSL